MLNISKLKKSLWKNVYGAYRSYSKASQEYLLACDNESDSYEYNIAENKGELRNHKYELLQSKIALIDEYDKSIVIGVGTNITALCKSSFDKDPYYLGEYSHTELLQARLLNHKQRNNDVSFLYVENDEIPVKIKNAAYQYMQIKYDTTENLSAYQIQDLLARKQYRYGFLGSIYHGQPVKRKLP